MWRGSLLPLECAALPGFGAASQPNGSKLPRHNFCYVRRSKGLRDRLATHTALLPLGKPAYPNAPAPPTPSAPPAQCDTCPPQRNPATPPAYHCGQSRPSPAPYTPNPRTTQSSVVPRAHSQTPPPPVRPSVNIPPGGYAAPAVVDAGGSNAPPPAHPAPVR